MSLQANGFDWDKGNRAKGEKHGLSTSIIESLFTRPLAILPMPPIRNASAAFAP